MKNLILDLNETLVNSTRDECDLHKLSHRDMGAFKIIERPRLQYFLDYAFKHYNVSIWTASKKGYTLDVVKNHIIGSHHERKLNYIFYSYHCKISEKHGKCFKDLDVLSKVFGLDIDKKDTLIVDDKFDVYNCQRNNAIRAPVFDASVENAYKDEFLTELIGRLERWRKLLP